MTKVKHRHSLLGGQTLVEFALLLPLMFLLIINVVNFGGFFFAWITVANAARAGVQHAVTGGATVGGPHSPCASAVYSVVQADVSSLPNRSSVVVRTCSFNNCCTTPPCCTTTPTGGASFSDPPADPEAPLYTGAWVDVRYTYQPFIPLWSFPGLGVYLTLPPATIHRQAVMRMIQ